ncbi:hypothetical protein RUM44_010175 [Polyplax serrata]|uniref:Uncharacterized protein n=1 Tax=Polyplax serrata TaxID=468196 RepID=A0ABR1AVE7_POLSC
METGVVCRRKSAQETQFPMFFQDCESSLKQKTELVTKLEAKTALITETFQKLEEKYEKLEKDRLTAEESKRNLSQKLAEKETIATSAEGDLKIEREWRTSLQDSMVKDRNKMSQMTQEMSLLKAKAEKYDVLKAEHEKLKEHCSQQELTLEELGVQLSVSRLKVADLEEEARMKTDGQWASDKEVQSCKACTKEFNLRRRKVRP